MDSILKNIITIIKEHIGAIGGIGAVSGAGKQVDSLFYCHAEDNKKGSKLTQGISRGDEPLVSHHQLMA
jgi:hypothetical protein